MAEESKSDYSVFQDSIQSPREAESLPPPSESKFDQVSRAGLQLERDEALAFALQKDECDAARSTINQTVASAQASNDLRSARSGATTKLNALRTVQNKHENVDGIDYDGALIGNDSSYVAPGSGLDMTSIAPGTTPKQDVLTMTDAALARRLQVSERSESERGQQRAAFEAS